MDVQVINLSAKILQPEHLALLTHGLTFSPMTHFDHFKTILDINKFVRDITIRKHFEHIPEDSICTNPISVFSSAVRDGGVSGAAAPAIDLVGAAAPDSTVSEPQTLDNSTTNIVLNDANSVVNHDFGDLMSLSHLYSLGAESTRTRTNMVKTNFTTTNRYFYPIQSRTDSLDRFQDHVARDLAELQLKTPKKFNRDNLSKSERTALVELKNNHEIVIRPADKGGNIIILDAELYKNLNNTMLSDTVTYAVLKTDPTTQYAKIMYKLLERGVRCGIFNLNQAEYMLPSHPQMAIYHSFPKVHKGIFPPPLRPIVAGIGSQNERLCAWIDAHLQPLVPLLPGYLKDTKEVLKAISGTAWNPDTMWISADVVSLYTSIPHAAAITALRWFLEVYSDYDIELQDMLCVTTEYLLSHNFFMFDSTLYLQKVGASMGAKFSPSIANIYMGWWENKFLFSETNPLCQSIKWYGRYIDDLLLVAVADVTAVSRFSDFLNCNPLNLKFTVEHDKFKINFLDVTLLIKEDKIVSESFRKTTAGNTILHYNSCHPKHVRNNIPYGEYIRALRNCSETSTFVSETNKITSRLRSRGYPEHVLSKAITKVSTKCREDLLKDKCTNKNKISPQKNPVTFSTTYSVEYPKICKIISKHIPNLLYDPSLSLALDAGYRCVARRAPTLGQNLSPSLFTTATPNATSNWLRYTGSVGCGHNICRCCTVMKKTSQIVSMTTGNTFKIYQHLNCNSSNIIYVIGCEKCKLQYVGHTSQKLKERIRKHLSDVPFALTRNISAASQHFAAKHVGSLDSCSVTAIEKVSLPTRGGDLKRKLLNRETFWMHRLQTISPLGLNLKQDMILLY